MSRTVKVKSSHPASQGDFVEIEAADFDPTKHELIEGETLPDDAPEGETAVARFIRFANAAQAAYDALSDAERAEARDTMGKAAAEANDAAAKLGKKTAKAVKETAPPQSADINAGAPGWNIPAA